MSRHRQRWPATLAMGEGYLAFCSGVAFVLITPRVWLYALVPVTVLLFLACGGCVGGAYGAWEAAFHIVGKEAGAWGQAGGWLLTVLLAIVFILVGQVLALTLAQPLSGFALDAIVHAHERELTGRVTPRASFFRSAWNALRVAVISLVLGGPILVLLLAIGLFFPPATVVTIPLKFLVCGWMLAWDFFDYPLTMRGLGMRARADWMGRHFLAFTLFGTLWALLTIVPGVVLLLLPMGVAGATYMVVAAERKQAKQDRESADAIDDPIR